MERDVETERLRATLAEVAAERDRLAEIFDILHEGIVIVDHDQIIRRFNRGASDIFGYAPNEIIGRPLDVLLPIATALRHRALVGGFTGTSETSRYMGARSAVQGKRKDGSVFPAEISIAKSRNGDRWTFSAVVRDTTDAQRLEAQLLQAQKLDALGTLSAGIAHDLNNALVPIMSYAEVIAASLAPNTPDRRFADKILTAAAHARDLVRRIVEFSRDDSRGAMLIDPTPTLRRAAKMLRDALPSRVALTVKIGRNLPVVRINPTELGQALVNLVTNASQAIGGRPGRVDVSVDSVEIDAQAAARHIDARPGRYVRISVSDDGPGMDETVRARVFEPFFTTKPPGEGSGLGLAVVHRIFRNHMGFVELESAPGKGATFRCYLPTPVAGRNPAGG